MVVPLFVGLLEFIVQNFRMVNPKSAMGSSQSNYLIDDIESVFWNFRSSKFLDDQLTSGFEFVLTERLRILLSAEVFLNHLVSLHGSEVILLNYIVLSS
jgi:hypothetical protein